MEKNKLHSNLALFNGLDQTQFPLIIIHDLIKGSDYKFVGNFSLNEINEFVEKWYSNKIDPYLKSELYPRLDNNKIIKLTRNSFEEIIFEKEKDKDVIVNFYANWNKNSRKFKKVYKEFFNKMKNNNNIKIAKIDVSKNHINDFLDIDYLPTIMLFNTENKTSPIEFDDEKTLENLIIFIEQNTKNSSLLSNNSINTGLKTDL